MGVLRLHGVPLSQPVRAVAWACAQKRLPFELRITIPGVNTKAGSRHADFLKINPLGTVPTIVDGDVIVTESGAILSYLSEKHQWSDLLPTDLAARSVVSSYCFWHQSNTRRLASLFGPKVRTDIVLSAEKQERLTEHVDEALQSLESHWLMEPSFIGGRGWASIADLLAYEEVATVSMLDLHDLSPYPNIRLWMGRMAELPYHAEVHTSLVHLGSLSEQNETPVHKRVAAATKAGLAELAKVQGGTI